MENLNIYERIAERAQGNIYIGVVGPVRTGKSTFIKRFMDLMVLPHVENVYVKERVRDELPQSGTGRTIMTTEPKFVPADAVNLTFSDSSQCSVRMVDCVGYLVPGALGHIEDGRPRMVTTPWFDQPIPFEEAAETGTRKVITDHSTIGIVVTTDGSIGDLERNRFLAAEERVIRELRALSKPFLVLLNSTRPEAPETQNLRAELEKQYRVPVKAVDCMKMEVSTLQEILEDTLNEFPVAEIRFVTPGFVEGLSNEHWIKDSILKNIKVWGDLVEHIRDVKTAVSLLADGEIIQGTHISNIDLGTGHVDVELVMAPELYYQVIGEILETEVTNDAQFFRLIREYSKAKKNYDKLAEAMVQVSDTGYGIVQPKLSEMVLEEPEIFKQGSKFGVRLKAKAPSLHIIKTDITTEVSPVVGSEKQSEDLIKYLITQFEHDPAKIWETNIFGKSLYEMVTEQMEHKLSNVPDNIRSKVQRSLQRISDEGKDYFICIII